MNRRSAIVLVALALLPAGAALAEAPPPLLRGGWVATAGAQVFRGRWTAQALPSGPNTVQGSWTLIGPADEIVLEGTWSALKAPRGWRGTWSARIKDGRILSGSWEAARTGIARKTFLDMLEGTAAQRIAGSWRSGRARGSWWLEGAK